MLVVQVRKILSDPETSPGYLPLFGVLVSASVHKGEMLALAANKRQFDWFFDVARTYGLSPENCKVIARVEMGKALEEFSHDELIAFAARITGVKQNAPQRQRK